MLSSYSFLLLAGFTLCSCSSTGPTATSKPRPPVILTAEKSVSSNSPASKPIITPVIKQIGTVVSVNNISKYAVLRFDVGGVPVVNTPLSAYRHGLKVGELRMTRWQQGENAVADVLDGEALISDEIRAK